jgi:hypothetical protein
LQTLRSEYVKSPQTYSVPEESDKNHRAESDFDKSAFSFHSSVYYEKMLITILLKRAATGGTFSTRFTWTIEVNSDIFVDFIRFFDNSNFVFNQEGIS